jgi:hypothetical protein
MPVIASRPAGYAGTAADYYLEIAAQTTVTPALVQILPEQLLPANPLVEKGLLITITDPSASFVPAAPLAVDADAPAPPPAPFATLFALMGGWLSYVRATPGAGLDLTAMLAPPFDSITPPPEYPAPAGLDPAAQWGAFVLRLWGVDFQRLAESLPEAPACTAVYYLGVDELSARSALAPLAKLHFPLDRYDASIAANEKPVLQDVMEEVKGQAYTGAAPSHADLIDDYLDALLDGATNLLVQGGSAIGEAVQVPDPGAPSQSIGRVELWFLDDSSPPNFIDPTPLLRGAPAYDF